MKRAYAMGKKPLDVVCACGVKFTRTSKQATHGEYACIVCRREAARRWKRAHGIQEKKHFTPDRFWARVDKTGVCWLWTGAKNSDGYGSVGGWDRSDKAHRIAYELEIGPIPAGLSVLHHCDNPPCVRPDHLWLGTQADNVHDMLAKGRGNTKRRGTA